MASASGFQKEYCYGCTVPKAFQETIDLVKQALAANSFGVVSEIDIAAKFKEKLGKDTEPHVIIGACNPKLAWTLLQHEGDAAVLLPCNVALKAVDATHTRVSVQHPMNMFGKFFDTTVESIAATAKVAQEKLDAVVATLSAIQEEA